MKLLDEQAETLVGKLNNYLAEDKRYKVVFEYTKKRFDDATHLTAHNWAHAYRYEHCVTGYYDA
jgi:hypothetical protein